MSTPNPPTTTDAPYAEVGIGPSEITSFIVIVGGLLESYFGNDWGVAKNAQALGILVAGLATLGMTVSRAIKHHGAAHANAATYAAQLSTVLSAVKTDGVSVAGVTNGLNALNNVIVADTGAPAEGDAAP